MWVSTGRSILGLGGTDVGRVKIFFTCGLACAPLHQNIVSGKWQGGLRPSPPTVLGMAPSTSKCHGVGRHHWTAPGLGRHHWIRAARHTPL